MQIVWENKEDYVTSNPNYNNHTNSEILRGRSQLGDEMEGFLTWQLKESKWYPIKGAD